MIDDESVLTRHKNDFKELAAEISTASQDKAQKLLDNVFTEERSDELLKQASIDIHGRKVRYYREMSMESFATLMQQGEIDVLDHFAKPGDTGLRREKLEDHPDFDSIYTLLQRHAIENLGMQRDESRKILNPSEKEKFTSDPEIRLTALQKLFPNADQQVLLNLAERWNYETLIPFFELNLPHEFIKKMHTGSLLQKYSPYLSSSVGGPINERLNSGRVVVEMVIPDDEVIQNEFGVTGEKEVFLQSIQASHITRVFATSESLRTKVLQNPETQVGDYYAKVYSKLPTERQYSTSLLEEWRWKVPTKDCLPQSISTNYIHKGK